MIVVLVLVLRNYPTAEPGVPLAQQLGAELGAPANPAESYAAARPEVYFLVSVPIAEVPRRRFRRSSARWSCPGW